MHHLEGPCAGKSPESLDRLENIQEPGYRLGQMLDGTLLGVGEGQLSGGFLQAGPGVVPELPQAVVRQRLPTDRHGHHLRDSTGCPGSLASRLKVTMPPAGTGEQEQETTRDKLSRVLPILVARLAPAQTDGYCSR